MSHEVDALVPGAGKADLIRAPGLTGDRREAGQGEPCHMVGDVVR